jgi:hypothetical protein
MCVRGEAALPRVLPWARGRGPPSIVVGFLQISDQHGARAHADAYHAARSDQKNERERWYQEDEQIMVVSEEKDQSCGTRCA